MFYEHKSIDDFLASSKAQILHIPKINMKTMYYTYNNDEIQKNQMKIQFIVIHKKTSSTKIFNKIYFILFFSFEHLRCR